MTESLISETNNKSKYKPHILDNLIVKFLENIDKNSFDSKDKIFFFKEFSYLSAGGVGIIDSMDLIYNNSDNFAIKQIAKSIFDNLKKGKTLSYCLSKLPDYFNEGDVFIIKSGEASGNLTLVLQSLAREYSYLGTIKNKYIGALMYPLILIVISIGAVLGLFLGILPQIFGILDTFPGIELPWQTVWLKNISDFLLMNGEIILSVSAVSIFLMSTYFSTNSGKGKLFNFIISIPIVGKMTKYYYLIKRCRYMKIMFSSGMSYVETFTLLKNILNINLYKDMIERILNGLQKGESIYNTLRYEQQLIPTNVATLIKVGEESANLESSIDNILDIYQEELETLIDRLGKIVEPIMLIFIGGLVLIIAWGVFGLILQVMEGVQS